MTCFSVRGVAVVVLAVAAVRCGSDNPGTSETAASTSTGMMTTGDGPSTGEPLPTTTVDPSTSAGPDSDSDSASSSSSSSSSDSTGASTTEDPTEQTDTSDSSSTTAVTTETTGDPGVCGDGIRDAGEDCDGTDLGGQDCSDAGFDQGELACTRECTFDVAGCSSCGDGIVGPGETCDDGNTESGDGCDANCQTEEPCDPDGNYQIQGAPVAYTCCLNLVNINIQSFLFTNDGASIASSPSNPKTMTGAATTCPNGTFDNSAEIAGGCTEIFSVSGTFTDANTWTGVYSLEFVGEQCSCFGGMIGTPCVNQVFPVTAQR